MKKILPIIAGLLLFGYVQAQTPKVQWHTIEEASSAKIGQKIYFVDFYTTWCSFCKRMDRETFTDPTVAAILNRYYYPVKFNAEGNNTVNWAGKTFRPYKTSRGTAHEFAKGLQGFPTFVLYKADQSMIQAIPGFSPARDFVIILWYFASGDCDKYPFERYKQIFDKEIRPAMEKELER